MRIRITGKGLKKYQNAGPVTASGQPVMYNKVMLRPGQSYTDPQTGKITTYEQALKKINDIENENIRTQASLDALKNQDDAERAGDLADFNRHETVKVSSIPSASASIPKTFPSIQPFPAPTSFTGSMPNVQQAPIAEPDKVDLSGFKPPVIAGYKEEPLVAPVDPQEEAAKKAEADFRAKNPNAPINSSTMPGLADQVAQRADPTGYEMDQRIKNDPKYARQLKRSLKDNATYKTIGAASGALTGAIYAAGALTDFVDNKNKQNDFKSYMRDQQMSDNLFPVQPGSRGDYVQTGTSYGQFRPDQMTVNKGMFAQYGGSLINDKETQTVQLKDDEIFKWYRNHIRCGSSRACYNFEWQFITGKLDPSRFTPPQPDRKYQKTKLYVPKTDNTGIENPSRFFQGYVLSFSPKWIKGLTIGHIKWVQTYNSFFDVKLKNVSGLNYYFPVFDSKINYNGYRDGANGFFFRSLWVDSNAEIYGEFYTKESNQDFQDSPIAHTLGLQKLFKH